MVEVKAVGEMNEPMVLEKKDKAVKYCELASKWSKLNGYREWEYALIPDSAIGGTMTFAGLIGRYKAK